MNIRQWSKLGRKRPGSAPRKCDKDAVCDYQLVGELKDNDQKLLLMGADGQYYAYDLTVGDIVALNPDDSWALDVTFSAPPQAHMSPDKVA